MEDRQLEEISGGAAVASQAIIIFFVIPFLLFLAYLVLRVNVSLPVISVIVVMFALAGFGLMQTLSYADVYFCGNILVIKKITGTVRRPVSDYKTIEEGFRTSTYYIEFNDGTKVYFTLKTIDLLKRVTNSGTDVAKIFIERFEEKKGK
jgi:hypothetical protein